MCSCIINSDVTPATSVENSILSEDINADNKRYSLEVSTVLEIGNSDKLASY